MAEFNKFKTLYYGTTAVVSLILITLLMSILSWPLPAEIALGSALWVHALILSRSAKDLFLKAIEKGMLDELFFSLKTDTEVSERNTKS